MHLVAHILLDTLIRLWLLHIHRAIFLNDVGFDFERLLLNLQNTTSMKLSSGGTITAVARLASVSHHYVIVIHNKIVHVIMTSEDSNHLVSLTEGSHDAGVH